MSNVMATSLVPSIHWNSVRHATPQEAKSISHRRRLARRLAATPSLSVLRPLVEAGALIFIMFALIWAVPGLIDSSEQRSLHRAAVHSDATAIQTGISATLKTPIEFVYRDINGTVHRVLADETEANSFINDTLIYLDSERSTIKADIQKQVATLLETAFSDRQDAIGRFADWYFAWGRSWTLLQEAVVGGLKGASINNVQGIVEGSRNEVEAYLIQNYQRLVLKPELRNPELEAGVSRILANAHARYIAVLSTMEQRTQVFLSQSTRHLEVVHPESKVRMSLDWDAQKWKARYLVSDETSYAALRGSALLAVSVLVAKELGPTIERSLVQIFSAPAKRVVTAMGPQIFGAVTGSAFEPGVGTLAGWLIGAGGALAFDYLSNTYRDYLDRPEFEKISAEALSVTMDEWSRAIRRDLFTAVDAWFGDTRTIVAEQRIRKN